MSKLVGCITVGGTQAVTGASVTASAQGKQLRTVANADGCYEFETLPPNVYRVTVRGSGINNVTRDKVTVTAGRTERVDFSISGSIVICDCAGSEDRITNTIERYRKTVPR